MDHRTELLAPAGTWDMLEAAIAEGADALYLGGKKFNMRLHRQDVNFDDSQLAKAVQYAHKHVKKRGIMMPPSVSSHILQPAPAL